MTDEDDTNDASGAAAQQSATEATKGQAKNGSNSTGTLHVSHILTGLGFIVAHYEDKVRGGRH